MALTSAVAAAAAAAAAAGAGKKAAQVQLQAELNTDDEWNKFLKRDGLLGEWQELLLELMEHLVLLLRSTSCEFIKRLASTFTVSTSKTRQVISSVFFAT